MKSQNKIFSEKNTSLKDNKNQNFYTVEKFRYFIKDKLFRGKKIKLITKSNDEYLFDDGLINLSTNEMEGKDLEANFDKNKFGNNQNEPRLKGNKAYNDPKVTKISKAVFTTCKRRENDKCPPWVIQAKEAKHDKEKKIIYYKNAWLKVYNVPVFYYPLFFHPDPTVKRQSGFLKPEIGDSQLLGTSAYTPYFYAISDSKDLTIKPRLFNDGKYTFQNEYRQVTKNTYNILDFSITQGHKSSELHNKASRTHFFSNSKINFNFDKFDYSNLEIQLQKTSNDTYLKTFNLESPLIENDTSTLHSFANLELAKEDLSFDAEFAVYEKLGNLNSNRYEFIFPRYNLSKIIDTKFDERGTLTLNSSGSQNLYNTNVYEGHIINDLTFASKDKFLDSGIINNYNILVKNVNTNGKKSSKYKDTAQSELLSTFLFSSSYPLLRNGMHFDSKINPKFSIRYSPNSMKDLRDDDSKLLINNIWSLDRVAATDTVESGQSITVGSEFNFFSKKKERDILSLELATVFRDQKNEDLPIKSSLGNKSSDVVGNIDFNPNDMFKIDYNFSVDNNLDLIKYNELSTTFSVNNFVTSFKYLEEKGLIGDESYIKNNTSYKLNENSSFHFSTRKNKKIDLTEFYNLIYEYKNDCLTAALKYKKQFYTDNDLKPTEDLFFSITISPIWAYESKNILLKENLIKSLNTFD